MSLNVGTLNSRYVVVTGVTMRYAFSEKVLFADLRTSRKTGKPKTDKKTGEVITDKSGKPIPEREYTHWEGRFVGNAFEPAKALGNGQAIDIVNGWVSKEEKMVNGQRYVNVFVVITDFVLSDSGKVKVEAEDEELSVDAIEQCVNDVNNTFRYFNWGATAPTDRDGGRG